MCTRIASALTALLALGATTHAGTQTPDPASAAPASAAPASATPASATPEDAAVAWRAQYDAATRDLLYSGRFDAARVEFDRLAGTAPTPDDAAAARALSRLAADLLVRDLVWVKRAELGESEVSARSEDRRTSTEMAQLYVAAAAYGIGTGLWLAVQTEPESVAAVTLPTLALGVAAPVGVYLLDDRSTLRYGTPTAILSGLTVGLTQGALWTTYYQAQARAADEFSGRTMATLVWLPTTLGAVAGCVLGETFGTTPGRAELVAAGSTLAATFTGLLTAALLPDDIQRPDDYVALSAALASNAGAVGGWFLGRAWSPSIARVRYLQLGALGGGAGSALLFLTFAGKDSEPRAAAAVTAIGLGGGVALATVLTSGMAPDNRRELSGAASAQLLIAPGADGVPRLALSGQF